MKSSPCLPFDQAMFNIGSADQNIQESTTTLMPLETLKDLEAIRLRASSFTL